MGHGRFYCFLEAFIIVSICAIQPFMDCWNSLIACTQQMTAAEKHRLCVSKMFSIHILPSQTLVRLTTKLYYVYLLLCTSLYLLL